MSKNIAFLGGREPFLGRASTILMIRWRLPQPKRLPTPSIQEILVEEAKFVLAFGSALAILAGTIRQWRRRLVRYSPFQEN